MSELLDRAKASLSDHQWAKVCRVESLYPERLMSQLIAEVERLEAGLAEERESHMETAAILRRARNRLGDVDE